MICRSPWSPIAAADRVCRGEKPLLARVAVLRENPVFNEFLMISSGLSNAPAPNSLSSWSGTPICPEGTMSLTIFLALCILGVDFMVYAFFQWTYGDKRSALVRRLAASKSAHKEQSPQPFLVASQKAVHGSRG